MTQRRPRPRAPLSCAPLSCAPLSCALISCALLACSARPPAPTPANTAEVLEMDTLLIRGGGGEALSGDELFEEAVGALQSQRFEECAARFGDYQRLFPDHYAAQHARYNYGLCLEHLGRFGEAAGQFARYAEVAREEGEPKDALDGDVRRGYCLVYARRYAEAVPLYTRLLTEEPIIGFDRAECHLRRAMARLGLGEFGEADRDLSLALSHINGAIGDRREGNEALAETHFQRGELFRRHMRAVALKMPVKRMQRLFADKVLFFRKALYAYVDCLNVHHARWGVAAGHQLGALHEALYEDLMWAETPPDFDEETLAFYYFELEKKLAPLLGESISIYERTATLSATKGVQGEWADAATRNLRRLRGLEERVQRRLTLEPGEAHRARLAELELVGPPPPKGEEEPREARAEAGSPPMERKEQETPQGERPEQIN